MPSSPQQPQGSQARQSQALQALAQRSGAQDLVLVDSAAVSLSGGRSATRYSAVRRSDANGPQHSVVLDASGAEVEESHLSAAASTSGDTATLEPAPVDGGTKPVVTASATISPSTNNLVLNPGDTFPEVITVTIPPNTTPAKADVYFLADVTGSMGSHIAAVQAGANQILNDLAALGIDIAYGVGSYNDFPGPPTLAFQHQLSPTSSTAAVTAAIGTWAASGGGDYPEGQLFALDQLAVPPGGTIGWRAGAERIIVWFGDAPAHDPVCSAISGLSYTITEATATAKLVAEQITVLAISVTTPGLDDNPAPSSFDYNAACGAPGGTAGQGTRIANATGGIFVTGINPSTIVSTITSLITTAVTTINNLSLVPTGGIAPFVTSISPAGGYGPLASDQTHVLPFDVVFTGVVPCTSETQVFTGTIDAVADGGVVASKTVTITVPPCESRRRVYSVKYVCGWQHDERGCPVLPGRYATDVNIHNPSGREARIEKVFIPLVVNGEPIGREPRYSQPRAKDFIVLPPMSATMDDCCRIAELMGLDLGSLNIGFLQITSDADLEVVAVYTASGFDPNMGVSIDVEQVEARLL